MTNIAHRGFEQIAMGKLAEKQARSADVREFAQQLMVTHSAINDEVIILGSRKNLRVSRENLGTVVGNNPKVAGLAWGAGYVGREGVIANYDKRWASVMEQMLRDDLSDCADEAKNGNEAEVKAWATKTFEALRKDLLRLMEIRAKFR
jgi:putative membrane protein